MIQQIRNYFGRVRNYLADVFPRRDDFPYEELARRAPEACQRMNREDVEKIGELIYLLANANPRNRGELGK